MSAQIVPVETKYQTAFREVQSTASSPAAWLQLLRDSAMDRFEHLGWPIVHDEEWKYTNLAALGKREFDPVIATEATTRVAAAALPDFTYEESVNSQLVVVDGVLQQSLCSLEAVSDIVALELSTAISDHRYAEIIREYLARGVDYTRNGVAALNTAFLTSGVFLLIPRNVKFDSPLHILFLSSHAETPQASFPRLLVVAEENSSATIIESYAGENDSQYLTNAVVEVVLKDRARLEHYRVQNEGSGAFHLGNTAIELGQHSQYDSTAINIGGQLSRHDIKLLMDREGAECWLDGLYIAGQGQHHDTHSSIDHRQPRCTSRQLYKGILDGNGRAVFNGKVFVRHGAQKTDAMQTNKNLLLSPAAHVDTKPQLEILADDVKCAHGAAVGQLDEEELFYLETRGIHPHLARNLLTYGFAEELIGKIKIESIRRQLDDIVLNRLNAVLEA